MGIIKATMQAISGGLSDQYLEKIVPYDMGAQTVFTYGVVENSGDNKKRTDNVISNGSKIQVYDNQMMLLVDGGKVVDYTAEPGLYEVSNSSMPSLFNGQFGDSLKEAFNRVRFGGGTPQKQEVFYINLQEIKEIKFGTRIQLIILTTCTMQNYSYVHMVHILLRLLIRFSSTQRLFQETAERLRLLISMNSIFQNFLELCRLQSIRCLLTE